MKKDTKVKIIMIKVVKILTLVLGVDDSPMKVQNISWGYARACEKYGKSDTFIAKNFLK